MRDYIYKRIILMIPTLIGISILVFLLIRLIPGTVVDQLLGLERTEEGVQALQAYFGLDRPIHVQYLSWASGVLRGDLGESWRSGIPVQELILQRLPITVQLTVGAMIVALLVGIPLGIVSAIKENSPLDHVARVVSLFSLSMPIFWQAAMLVLILSRLFRWAPPMRYVDPFTDPIESFRIMALPSLVLGTAVAATIMRMARSSLLDVLRQEYIRTARAKGLRERTVVGYHALKNAIIPVITVAGLQVGYLLGGTVVTEEVFTLPGVGRLVLAAIYQRDYPVVQGTVLFIALVFMVNNLIVDLLYGYVDPRIRFS
jgi:peptide/nickel transport system permease protein